MVQPRLPGRGCTLVNPRHTRTSNGERVPVLACHVVGDIWLVQASLSFSRWNRSPNCGHTNTARGLCRRTNVNAVLEAWPHEWSQHDQALSFSGQKSARMPSVLQSERTLCQYIRNRAVQEPIGAAEVVISGRRVLQRIGPSPWK